MQEKDLPENYKIFGKSVNLLQELRKSVLSLGDDVVEDVRPHRIVYGRKTILRNFLDIRPFSNGIIATIRKGKSFQDPRSLAVDKGFLAELMIRPDEIDCALELIRQGYLSV